MGVEAENYNARQAMNQKPPEGFETWLDWCIQYRDDTIANAVAMKYARDELAELRRQRDVLLTAHQKIGATETDYADGVDGNMSRVREIAHNVIAECEGEPKSKS